MGKLLYISFVIFCWNKKYKILKILKSLSSGFCYFVVLSFPVFVSITFFYLCAGVDSCLFSKLFIIKEIFWGWGVSYSHMVSSFLFFLMCVHVLSGLIYLMGGHFLLSVFGIFMYAMFMIIYILGVMLDSLWFFKMCSMGFLGSMFFLMSFFQGGGVKDEKMFVSFLVFFVFVEILCCFIVFFGFYYEINMLISLLFFGRFFFLFCFGYLFSSLNLGIFSISLFLSLFLVFNKGLGFLVVLFLSTVSVDGAVLFLVFVCIFLFKESKSFDSCFFGSLVLEGFLSSMLFVFFMEVFSFLVYIIFIFVLFVLVFGVSKENSDFLSCFCLCLFFFQISGVIVWVKLFFLLCVSFFGSILFWMLFMAYISILVFFCCFLKGVDIVGVKGYSFFVKSFLMIFVVFSLLIQSYFLLSGVVPAGYGSEGETCFLFGWGVSVFYSHLMYFLIIAGTLLSFSFVCLLKKSWQGDYFSSSVFVFIVIICGLFLGGFIFLFYKEMYFVWVLKVFILVCFFLSFMVFFMSGKDSGCLFFFVLGIPLVLEFFLISFFFGLGFYFASFVPMVPTVILDPSLFGKDPYLLSLESPEYLWELSSEEGILTGEGGSILFSDVLGQVFTMGKDDYVYSLVGVSVVDSSVEAPLKGEVVEGFVGNAVSFVLNFVSSPIFLLSCSILLVGMGFYFVGPSNFYEAFFGGLGFLGVEAGGESLSSGSGSVSPLVVENDKYTIWEHMKEESELLEPEKYEIISSNLSEDPLLESTFLDSDKLPWVVVNPHFYDPHNQVYQYYVEEYGQFWVDYMSHHMVYVRNDLVDELKLGEGPLQGHPWNVPGVTMGVATSNGSFYVFPASTFFEYWDTISFFSDLVFWSSDG